MFRKLILAFGTLALAAGFAGSVSGPNSVNAKINLLQPSVVKGTELKAGEYRLSVDNEKLTIANGKTAIEATAKVETVDQKFDHTAIRYTTKDGKAYISEIRLGGTKTRILVNP